MTATGHRVVPKARDRICGGTPAFRGLTTARNSRKSRRRAAKMQRLAASVMQDGQPMILTKDELGVLNVSKSSFPLQA
jgi:F420-0:gamma-glutamyl ligase